MKSASPNIVRSEYTAMHYPRTATVAWAHGRYQLIVPKHCGVLVRCAHRRFPVFESLPMLSRSDAHARTLT